MKLLLVVGAVALAAAAAHAQPRNVIINNVRLTDGQVNALQQQYRVRIVDGD